MGNVIDLLRRSLIISLALLSSADCKKQEDSAPENAITRFQQYVDYMTPSFAHFTQVIKDANGDQKLIADTLINDPKSRILPAEHRWAEKKSHFGQSDTANVSAILAAMAPKAPEGTANDVLETAKKHKTEFVALNTRLSPSGITPLGQIDCSRYPDSPACDGDSGGGGCDTTDRYTKCMTIALVGLGVCVGGCIPLTAGICAIACEFGYAIAADACGDPCK